MKSAPLVVMPASISLSLWLVGNAEAIKKPALRYRFFRGEIVVVINVERDQNESEQVEKTGSYIQALLTGSETSEF